MVNLMFIVELGPDGSFGIRSGILFGFFQSFSFSGTLGIPN